MQIRSWSAMLLYLFLTLGAGVTSSSAQSDPLRGTWSGHWVPEDGARDAVTVRFSLEGDSVVGELVNPDNIEFDTVSFDREALSIVAEAESSELGYFKIEGRIEEETRLNGTLTRDDATGEMRLTKWTYVPRIR